MLYGGVMQKRWSVNSMMMAFVAFAIVLILWVSSASRWPSASPMHIFGADSGFFGQHVGQAGLDPEQHELLQAGARSHDTAEAEFLFPQSTLAYFQIVFAAITPILMLGSVLGRINFKAWIPFVALWTLLVYTINAFLIWGGGFFAQHGAVDFSGGYVIHLAAGVSGLRRRGGDRAAAAARPRGRRTEQPGDGRGRRRAAVDGLERLQRR